MSGYLNWMCISSVKERRYLPDVKDMDRLYKFVGQESWQLLTTLVGTKCKQCGLYEKDTFKSDDIFDEWELCPFNFTLDPEGHYVHLKDKEFNMTLSCPQCNLTHPQDEVSRPDDPSSGKQISKYWILVVVIVVVGVLGLAGHALVAYCLWHHKQRKEEQARFVQLFKDDEFLERKSKI
ncbi:unnamed protein product [Sphagnum balticum]